MWDLEEVTKFPFRLVLGVGPLTDQNLVVQSKRVRVRE